jgi:hypothetical protein
MRSFLKLTAISALALVICPPASAQSIWMLAGKVTAGADVTAPTLSSATINTAGTTLTLAFTETVSVGAGGNGGWTVALSAGTPTLSYSSGSGSSSLVYTLSTTVNSGVTGTVAYTQPGNGLEDTAGNDLATIGSSSITNNSTAGGGTPALMQSKSYASSANSTTHTVTFDSTATSGRMLIVCFSADAALSGGTPSGWTSAVTGSDWGDAHIFYKTSNGTETNFAVTLASSVPCEMYFMEYTALTAVDQTASAIGQGVSNLIGTGTTGTTTQAVGVCVAVGIWYTTNSASSWSNSFTEVADILSTGTAHWLGVATLATSATGTYTTSATISTSGTHGVGVIAAFK